MTLSNIDETTSTGFIIRPSNIIMGRAIVPTMHPTIAPIQQPIMDSIMTPTKPMQNNTSFNEPPFRLLKLKTNTIRSPINIYRSGKYI